MPTEIKGQNSEILSAKLLDAITKGLDFTIPNVNFDDPNFSIPSESLKDWLTKVPRVTVDDLTEIKLDGNGVFDKLLRTYRLHLNEEYDKGRITGAEYATTFASLSASALQFAVEFLISKDKAYWDAVQAQINAITSNINTNTAKVQLAIAQAQAHTNKAQYANTVLKLATEDTQFGVAKEQLEQVRAQTLDTRTDGTVVTGAIGMQKNLYNQQIDSYKKDAELKAAKVWADAFTAQKSIDEGTKNPPVLNSESIDTVLSTLKRSNNLG